MNLKVSLLAYLLLFSFAATAQDKIYSRNGTVIDGKVKTIAGNKVIYKRVANPDGPDYSMAKKDIIKIVYQNGTTESFDNYAPKERRHGKMWQDESSKVAKGGNNILAIIPGAYTADLDGTMSDPGLGISYERLLDERGHIGFALPVIISFLSDRDFTNNNFSSYQPPYNVSAAGYTSFAMMPGIKFYPRSKSHTVRYALGASFLTMFGKQPFYVYDYNIPSTDDHRYAVYGLMLSNSLNVSAAKHFYLALDFNGIIPVSDNRRAHKNDFERLMLPMVQFLLKVGYRF